jgi:hypothetical protein
MIKLIRTTGKPTVISRQQKVPVAYVYVHLCLYTKRHILVRGSPADAVISRKIITLKY